MPTPGLPSQSGAPTDRRSRPRDAYRTYARIVSLARGTTSEPQFLKQVLRCVTRCFASPYAALHVRYPSQVLQDDYHAGPADPNFWKASLQEFLTDSLGARAPRAKMLRAKQGDTKVAFISAPFFDDAGSTIGCLALVLAPVSDGELPGRLATLEAATGLASACTTLLGTAGAAEASRDDEAGGSGSKASTAALARAGAVTSAEELAFSITNQLCNKTGFEQVALGLVTGKRVRVLSISGLDQVNRRSPGVEVLTAAMEECLDAGEPIAYQAVTDASSRGCAPSYRLHKRWHAAGKGGAVASIPLRHANATVAILSLRDRTDRVLAREQLDGIRARVEPYAQALLLAGRANRSLLRHARDSGIALGGAVAAPGRFGRKVVAGFLVLATLWFFFGSLPYHPTVPCSVRPARVRHIASPFDGTLAAVHLVEGDRMRKGDVLCEFDQRDIEQQIARLNAELEVLERERDWAIAADKPVEAQLAVAKQHLVRAKLDIARRQAERAVIRAPFDGLIVSGDLRKDVGSPMTKGNPLYEVAPAEQWQLELEVPQASMGDLRENLTGAFMSRARPEEVLVFRIAHVLGTAQSRDGRNVYLAEADLTTNTDRLRPGMEGAARIDFGPRPVWWIALHGIIDYLRMTLWL